MDKKRYFHYEIIFFTVLGTVEGAVLCQWSFFFFMVMLHKVSPRVFFMYMKKIVYNLYVVNIPDN